MQYTSTVQNDNSYQGLLCAVIQSLRKRKSHGLVIALTSVNPSEGVSFVARRLLTELEKGCGLDGRLVDLGWLKHQALSVRENALMYEKDLSSGANSEGNPTHGREALSKLRMSYPFVLVDCPAISSTGDLFRMINLVDGVLLVVEANRTRRDQIRNAERQITLAGGTILGHILNKSRSDVPGWLDRWL